MLLPVLDNFVEIYYSYVNAISKSIVEQCTELDGKIGGEYRNITHTYIYTYIYIHTSTM